MLYFIAETKSAAEGRSVDPAKLRPTEKQKIRCAAAHFGSKKWDVKGALDDVDYRVVSKAAELP